MSIPLEERVPFPGAPSFFKRMWDYGPPNAPMAEPGYARLVIYGYSARSRFPEDEEVENSFWTQRKAFPSVCYSMVEPDGEYGFTPLAVCTEISEGEFLAAQRNGWRPGDFNVIDGSIRKEAADGE